MGFLTGRVAYSRFRVSGSAPGQFNESHIKRLVKYAVGMQKKATADGVEIGWTAGDHVLDTEFDREKNIVNDAMVFCLRVDSEKVPSELKQAYFQIELIALSKDNPSSRPSARQKREAREAARERLENESKDGRFTRRKAIPMMWDGVSNELLVAGAGVSVIDRLIGHFHQTFDRKFEPITAGSLAFDLAEARQQSRGVDDARPSHFVPGETPTALAWAPDDSSRDFFGNEFLLWLWYLTDSETDTVRLSDNSEAAVMLARSLTLECPRGQTGKEVITSAGPASLPESRRAVQTGKLPRKCGLTVERQGSQYELTIQAETLSISGAKLPAPEEESDQARREERITRVRHLIETLDLLFDAFGRRRAAAAWPKDLAKIQQWLKAEGKKRTIG